MGDENAVFKNDYLTQDILLDLCIISCFVDGSNKAWYDYGDTVLVKMHPKNPSNNTSN